MLKIFLTTLEKIFTNVVKCFVTCKWMNGTWMNFLDEKSKKMLFVGQVWITQVGKNG
jgi:hypothetical protein